MCGPTNPRTNNYSLPLQSSDVSQYRDYSTSAPLPQPHLRSIFGRDISVFTVPANYSGTEPLKGHAKYIYIILLRSLEILLRSLAIILRSLEILFRSFEIPSAFPCNTFAFSRNNTELLMK